MIVLRDPRQLIHSNSFFITVLADSLQQYFQALSEPESYDPQQHGYIVIVEPNDTVAQLQQETGCPLLTDWFGECHYGDEDFSPAYEWLEELALCYVMGFTLNDDGFTVLFIVPKVSGVDSQLLTMCQENAAANIV